MSSSKTTAEDQMGSGESDDEFYNMNVHNLNKSDDAGKGSSPKVNSPKRSKIKYDYKFESSSDSDSDETSTRKNSKSGKVKASDSNNRSGKMRDSKLPVQTSMVVERINEELKTIKNGNDKLKKDAAEASTKLAPPSSACVPSPVVVVPQPIIVSQTHSVMAMAPAGMIVPPAIGLTNQNVMIPPPNILNLPGNVIRAPNAVGGIMAAAPGSAVMSMGNPNMIGPIQNQGSVLGMTNDILQLQGNIMGLAAPGNMMPMPGICVAGNMIPVQGALPSNLMRFPAPNAAVANQAIINNQTGLMANPGTMMSPGGVMLNTGGVMAVTNVVGNQANMMANAENLMLSMNNLGARMTYPGNALGAQAMNNAGNTKGSKSTKGVKKHDSQTQICSKEWRISSKALRKAKSLKKKKQNQNKWSVSDQVDEDGNVVQRKKEEEEEEVEEEEDEDEEVEDRMENRIPVIKESPNTFKNDGSFMEMFKKMNEANSSKAASNNNEKSPGEKKESEILNSKRPSVLISGIVGKRRGGRVLKTGLVKKVRKENENDEEKEPKDAWAVYMAEVKKYREASCEEEGKTRPLFRMKQASEIQLSTAPFDPRFPNTNQTRYCFQSYVDFHRCQKKRGETYEPCFYFQKIFKAICPNAWIENWDNQREAGIFPEKI